MEGCCSTIELHPPTHGTTFSPAVFSPAVFSPAVRKPPSGERRVIAAARPPGYRIPSTQWGLQDSNLRRHSQRIYSPPPLTTRANPQKRPLPRQARYGLTQELQILSIRSILTIASGGIRTHDRLITNQLLCQLSYAGKHPGLANFLGCRPQLALGGGGPRTMPMSTA